jgi:uncharacterized protein YheU (UPF0270 family)
LADFVQVPPARVPEEQLQALLEEFASRDGTDYGPQETALVDRVAQLRRQMLSGQLQLLFDASSDEWDLVPADVARRLLSGAGADD